ncbi:MAG: hypothetical protein ACLT98_09100 [Eggerthellaceae bacterium]
MKMPFWDTMLHSIGLLAAGIGFALADILNRTSGPANYSSPPSTWPSRLSASL